MCLLFVVYCFV